MGHVAEIFKQVISKTGVIVWWEVSETGLGREHTIAIPGRETCVSSDECEGQKRWGGRRAYRYRGIKERDCQNRNLEEEGDIKESHFSLFWLHYLAPPLVS